MAEPSLETLERLTRRTLDEGQGGAEQGEAAQIISTLVRVDANDVLGAGKEAKSLSLRVLQTREHSLRLLRDQLPDVLRQVYSESAQFLDTLDEIVRAILKQRDHRTLSKRMKQGDNGVIQESLSVVKNQLYRLEQHPMYAGAQGRCRDAANKAQLGAIRGERGAHLADDQRFAENLWGSVYGLCIVVFICSVLWFLMGDGVLPAGGVSAAASVIGSVLALGLAVVFLIFRGIHSDRMTKRLKEVQSRNAAAIGEFKVIQDAAAAPNIFFISSAVIVEAIKRNADAVLAVLDQDRLDLSDEARCALIENQLLVFWEVAESQQKKIEELRVKLNQGSELLHEGVPSSTAP